MHLSHIYQECCEPTYNTFVHIRCIRKYVYIDYADFVHSVSIFFKITLPSVFTTIRIWVYAHCLGLRTLSRPENKCECPQKSLGALYPHWYYQSFSTVSFLFSFSAAFSFLGLIPTSLALSIVAEISFLVSS